MLAEKAFYYIIIWKQWRSKISLNVSANKCQRVARFVKVQVKDEKTCCFDVKTVAFLNKFFFNSIYVGSNPRFLISFALSGIEAIQVIAVSFVLSLEVAITCWLFVLKIGTTNGVDLMHDKLILSIYYLCLNRRCVTSTNLQGTDNSYSTLATASHI